MSDSLFHFCTLRPAGGWVRDTVSKLPRVDWVVPTLAFAGVVTLTWIAFLLWVAVNLLEWSLS